MALILVVDDSPTQAMNLSKILTKYGHEVITAEDGLGGIDVAKAQKPDLFRISSIWSYGKNTRNQNGSIPKPGRKES